MQQIPIIITMIFDYILVSYSRAYFFPLRLLNTSFFFKQKTHTPIILSNGAYKESGTSKILNGDIFQPKKSRQSPCGRRG